MSIGIPPPRAAARPPSRPRLAVDRYRRRPGPRRASPAVVCAHAVTACAGVVVRVIIPRPSLENVIV